MMRTRIGPIVLAALLVFPALAWADALDDPDVYTLKVKAGDRSVTFSYAELKKMATKEHVSSRGSKKHPAIPIETLIDKISDARKTGLAQVVLLGKERSLHLEGDNLNLLKHLWLKLGDSHATIVPESDEAYYKLQPLMGKPRFKSPETIYIYEQHGKH